MADVAGLEFQRADGSSSKIEFTNDVATDFVLLLQGDPFRMFTDESMSDGTYTGVRLLLGEDERASVSRADGTQYPLRFAEGAYVPVSFSVEEDESSTASFALSLDLRKSLSYSEDDRQYTLTPTLRSAAVADAARIEGSVSVTCPAGTSLGEGGAVYLFSGADIEPNDIGSSVEPYATAAVVIDTFSVSTGYALRFLPAGDYTIALTCNGNNDRPGVDDDVSFIGTASVTVAVREVLTRNISN